MNLFRYLSAVGLSEQVEVGRLQRFMAAFLRDPELSKSAYVRAGQSAFFSEKRKNMGPFFLTVHEKASGRPELLELYPGVRETWGPTLTNLRLTEDGLGHSFLYGEECESGEPYTLLLTSLTDLLGPTGEVELGGTRRFSCYALATEGKILLGSEIDAQGARDMEDEQAWREELLRRAKDGDASAFDEMDRYMDDVDREIRERLKTEDLYSVLDGFFTPVIPQGTPAPLAAPMASTYTLLGEILHVDKMMNPLSEEWVYRLEVRVMGASIGVYINPRDLVGCPQKGFRFRGEVLLEGMADPEKLLSDADRGFF